jgi:hypothetical protein
MIDYLWNNAPQLLSLLGVALLSLFLFTFITRLIRRNRLIFSDRSLRDKMIHERILDEKYAMEYPDLYRKRWKKYRQDEENKLEEAIDTKKESFLNIANISFHYANKDEIKNFYNDYFKEPTVEKVISELANELGGSIKGSIPKALEAKIGGRDVKKWISTIKLPDISVAEMFKRYQRETINNDQVSLGLELVDVDLTDLESFDELLNKMKKEFEFHINEESIKIKRNDLMKKAADKTIVRLENASGSVLIEGKFKIIDFDNEFYKCEYSHPVNEYLPKGDDKVNINFMLKKDSLEHYISGNYSQSINKSIPLRVYGKVWQPLDRNSNVLELQLTPIAVY